MKHLNLAEMNLSQIILGTDGYSERIDKSTAFKIMECYTENGGNVIDTARLYCDGILSATPSSPNILRSKPNTSLYQGHDSATLLTPIPTCCTPQITFL
ncbi:MAG: aldo/keto reductase, partial [Clostridia bacterium]|nr:aldo/keto reductase [Clostridia bacterium]